MSSSKKYDDINYYELLGLGLEAEQATIRKAYRKKALECHPDKNPDNPKAVELFHQLSRALEVLTDEKAKAAYDRVLKGKIASQIRLQHLDAKRQKFKVDLDRREREAFLATESSKNYSVFRKSDEDILREELERLRREGSKLLEEEQRLMREKLLLNLKEQTEANSKFDSAKHRLKIKWNTNKKDPNNGGYSEEKLLNYFKKYGDIEAFVMSKKPGSAMVEFKTLEPCEMALKYEKGLVGNPLNLQWVEPPKPKQAENAFKPSVLDFEDLIMRQLRQAKERQRLIDQIQKEEAEDDEVTQVY